MNIDGVNFWSSNRHILRIWDNIDVAGPFVVKIDEKVRAGQIFTIFLQGNRDYQTLYRILQRQYEIKHECKISIIVQEPKTHQLMYDLFFRVTLAGVKFGNIDYTNSEPTPLSLSYICLEVIDRTKYDRNL